MINQINLTKQQDDVKSIFLKTADLRLDPTPVKKKADVFTRMRIDKNMVDELEPHQMKGLIETKVLQ